LPKVTSIRPRHQRIVFDVQNPTHQLTKCTQIVGSS
jgi:hypothetical protein